VEISSLLSKDTLAKRKTGTGERGGEDSALLSYAPTFAYLRDEQLGNSSRLIQPSPPSCSLIMDQKSVFRFRDLRRPRWPASYVSLKISSGSSSGSYIPDLRVLVSSAGIAYRVYNSYLSFPLISGIDGRVNSSLRLFSGKKRRSVPAHEINVHVVGLFLSISNTVPLIAGHRDIAGGREDGAGDDDLTGDTTVIKGPLTQAEMKCLSLSRARARARARGFWSMCLFFFSSIASSPVLVQRDRTDLASAKRTLPRKRSNVERKIKR